MAAHRPCTYQLAIRISRALCIRVGQLGKFAFPAGSYVYTGSARRAMDARLRRHFSQEKRLHWHIDYLLTASGASIMGVILSDAPECTVNRNTPGVIVAEGFGASDCTCGCGSHLKRIAGAPARRRLGRRT